MDYFRKIVSGKRRRFQDGNYDLDITYITPRVIAMSYPGMGMVETTYRNPASSVVRFLRERHGSHFRVFNCSERKYDHSRLDGRVSDFNWKDHHAPPLHLLFNFVKEMYNYLKEDERNVIAVHCNSGKGRTGSGIASLLLFSGFVDNTDDALRYYGWKRFSSGIGVSQPCQLRYIYYFEGIYNKYINAPVVKKLKAVVMKSIPRIDNDSAKVYLEVIQIESNQDERIIWTNKYSDTYGPNGYQISVNETVVTYQFDDGMEPICHGDMHYIFRMKGVMYDSLFCRIAFNTAFIPINNSLNFTKYTVSPDSLKKDKTVSDDFMIKLIFDDYCKQCNNPAKMRLDEFCEDCKKILHDDIVSWRTIQMIMSKHSYPTEKEGIKLHQSSDIDKATMLSQKLLFDSNQYKIKPRDPNLFNKQHSLKNLNENDQDCLEEEKKDHFDGFDYNNDMIGNHIGGSRQTVYLPVTSQLQTYLNKQPRPVSANLQFNAAEEIKRVENFDNDINNINNNTGTGDQNINTNLNNGGTDINEEKPEILEPDRWDA